MKKIEAAIEGLLRKNPFYAHFFLNSKVCYDMYRVPTAAAGLLPTTPVLIFNTKWIDTLTLDQVEGVIEHEIMHIMFNHVQLMKPGPAIGEEQAEHMIHNIAMDCAINQFIKTMPLGSVTLEDLRKATKTNLEPFQNWEYYHRELKPHVKIIKSKGFGPHDEHEANIPGQTKKEGEGKQVLASTTDKAVRAAKGNVPEYILKLYDELTAPAELPWQQILANFVSRSVSNTTRISRKKADRRFGIDQPGKLKKRELILGVCTDTSGSVSDESYIKFMNEIHRISKFCSTTYVVDADCEVHNVQKLKKGAKIDRIRRGAGGTAYQPAIEECKRRNCDAIIYFGDMDAADTPINPETPFLWVIVGSSEPPAKFGGKVRLT